MPPDGFSHFDDFAYGFVPYAIAGVGTETVTMENVQIAAADGAEINFHDGIGIAQKSGIVVTLETDVSRAVINEGLHDYSYPDFYFPRQWPRSYFIAFLASSSLCFRIVCIAAFTAAPMKRSLWSFAHWSAVSHATLDWLITGVTCRCHNS